MLSIWNFQLWLLSMWKPNNLTKLIRLIVLLTLIFECWVLFGLQWRPIQYVICRLSHCSIQYCKIIDVAKNLSVACIHFCINWFALWKVTDCNNKQRGTKNSALRYASSSWCDIRSHNLDYYILYSKAKGWFNNVKQTDPESIKFQFTN